MDWKIVAPAVLLAPLAAQAQEPLQMRPSIMVDGPSVTMGDVFENAGAAEKRVLAPAPPPGRTGFVATRLLVSAALAEGRPFTPPAEDRIAITRLATGAAPTAAGASVAAPIIRRGEMVTIVFEAPNLTITTRGRAMEDAAEGRPVRLSTSGSRTIDAVAIGPGRARVAQ